MKKIISTVLTLCMLFALSTIGVNASEIEDTLKKAFWDRTEDKTWNDVEYDPDYIDLVGYKEYEDIVVFSALNRTLDTMPVDCSYKMFDEWIVYNPGYYHGGYGFCLNVYVKDEAKIYDIVTAWNEGIFVDFDEIRDFDKPIVINKLGDTNFDGEINIKDATMIQKYIAGLVKPNDIVDSDGYDYCIYLTFNFDGMNDVNIKDATAIQKRIAGLEY